MGSTGPLRQLISTFHDTPLGGHSGQLGTFKRLAHYFYWPKMRSMVNDYLAHCEICHRNKDDNAAYPGLLQPLSIPNQAWSNISMDFIEGLPKSKSKDVLSSGRSIYEVCSFYSLGSSIYCSNRG